MHAHHGPWYLLDDVPQDDIVPLARFIAANARPLEGRAPDETDPPTVNVLMQDLIATVQCPGDTIEIRRTMIHMTAQKIVPQLPEKLRCIVHCYEGRVWGYDDYGKKLDALVFICWWRHLPEPRVVALLYKLDDQGLMHLDRIVIPTIEKSDGPPVHEYGNIWG